MAVAVTLVIAGTVLDYITCGSSPGTCELLVIKLNHYTGPCSRNNTTETTI
jgi:hypothetical protein